MLPGILNDSEGGRKLAKFMHDLELVRWFSNIGKHAESKEVEQFHSWEEWPLRSRRIGCCYGRLEMEFCSIARVGSAKKTSSGCATPVAR